VCANELPFASWWGVPDIAHVVSYDERQDEEHSECRDEAREGGELAVGKTMSVMDDLHLFLKEGGMGNGSGDRHGLDPDPCGDITARGRVARTGIVMESE
jgi:hypothetical protein